MQFSIARLFLLVTGVAFAVAATLYIPTLGLVLLPVGLLLVFAAGVAYPIVVLNSPQKGTQLDPASNPVLPYLYKIAGVGVGCIVLFVSYVALILFRLFVL